MTVYDIKKGYSDINFVQISDMKLFIFDIQDKVWKNDFTIGVSKMKIKNIVCLFFQMLIN